MSLLLCPCCENTCNFTTYLRKTHLTRTSNTFTTCGVPPELHLKTYSKIVPLDRDTVALTLKNIDSPQSRQDLVQPTVSGGNGRGRADRRVRNGVGWGGMRRRGKYKMLQSIPFSVDIIVLWSSRLQILCAFVNGEASVDSNCHFHDALTSVALHIPSTVPRKSVLNGSKPQRTE